MRRRRDQGCLPEAIWSVALSVSCCDRAPVSLMTAAQYLITAPETHLQHTPTLTTIADMTLTLFAYTVCVCVCVCVCIPLCVLYANS